MEIFVVGLFYGYKNISSDRNDETFSKEEEKEDSKTCVCSILYGSASKTSLLADEFTKGSRIESSSEVTRLRITRHGMAKLKSWCKRNTLSLSFFLSLLLLSSLFVRSKLNSPFLWRSSDCSRWYFSPGKLSTDNSRTILERIHRSLHTFEQKETARHFQAFSCFIEQRGRVETIFTESILDAALFKGIFKFFLNFIPSWKLCQLFISFELFCNFSYPKIKILRDDLIILRT